MSSDLKQRLVDNLLTEKVSAPTLALVRLAARSRWSEPRDVVDALEAVAVDAAMTRAEREEQLDEVEDELFRFERIIDGEPRLRAALTDRNLPADRKRDLVHRLLDGKAAAVTVSLVERAVLFPRGRTIERVLEEFTAFAAQRRSRLIARVTSAIPLTEEQQDRLSDALAREFGHEVRLQMVVEPELVGGITVRVGDELLDASVLRQLGTARRHLTGRSGRS
jgi:F-type H+-transporting ATPase subunit delta